MNANFYLLFLFLSYSLCFGIEKDSLNQNKNEKCNHNTYSNSLINLIEESESLSKLPYTTAVEEQNIKIRHLEAHFDSMQDTIQRFVNCLILKHDKELCELFFKFVISFGLSADEARSYWVTQIYKNDRSLFDVTILKFNKNEQYYLLSMVFATQGIPLPATDSVTDNDLEKYKKKLRKINLK